MTFSQGCKCDFNINNSVSDPATPRDCGELSPRARIR